MAIATGSEERSPSPDTQDPGQQAVISDYDEFVAEVGEFGLWQKMLCLILWFPAMAGGIHVLMYSFTGLAPYQYRLICWLSWCWVPSLSSYILILFNQLPVCKKLAVFSERLGAVFK